MTPAEKRELRAYCASGENCSCCKYPDCIFDELTERDLKEQKEIDAAARRSSESKLAAAQRAYREANREKLAAAQRAYREANKEKLAAAQRAYYEANKEKWILHAENRRRKQNAAPVPKHESGALCGEDRNQI